MVVDLLAENDVVDSIVESHDPVEFASVSSNYAEQLVAIVVDFDFNLRCGVVDSRIDYYPVVA